MNRDVNISQEELETLEQFIFQQMSADQNKAFLKELSTDLVLRQKLQTLKLLLVGVQETALEKKLVEFHDDLASIKKNRIQPSITGHSIKKWWAAASVLVIIGLGLMFIFNSHTQEEKLFASYFEPEPGLISPMGASDNYLFHRAMVDYKVGEYNAALKIWESLLASKTQNDTLNYFIGSAYLMKEKEEIAITHFEKVISIDNSPFKYDALWYAGLALIKLNRKAEALRFIEEAEHENKAALLRELKNME